MSDPERIERLPKWAQRHIERLEARATRAEANHHALKKELGARDAGDTPVLVRTFEGPEFGLSVDDIVQYTMRTPDGTPRDQFINVVYEPDGSALSISGGRGISVEPWASNRVNVVLR